MQELWVGILGTVGTILSTVSLMPQVAADMADAFGKRHFRCLANSGAWHQ